MAITLLIVESCEIVRIGLRVWLKDSKDITILGEAGNMAQAGRLLNPTAPPAVVLVDCADQETSILFELSDLQRQVPACKILLWGPATHSQRFIRAALRSGIRGYCAKNTSADLLREAVRTVADGKVWVHPLLKQNVQAAPVLSHRSSVLSFRESQIIHLVAEGFSNTQISAHLGISLDTVKTHVRKVLEKLDAPDRTQAAIKALRIGLIDERPFPRRPHIEL